MLPPAGDILCKISEFHHYVGPVSKKIMFVSVCPF